MKSDIVGFLFKVHSHGFVARKQREKKVPMLADCPTYLFKYIIQYSVL